MIHRVPKGFYSESFANHGGSFNSADSMDYTLILRNGNSADDEDENTNEVIDSFSVDSLDTSEVNIGNNTIYYARTLIFTPTTNASYLVFRLSRISYDVLIESRTWLLDTTTDISRVIYNANNGNPKTDGSGNVITVTTSGARIEYTSDANGDGNGDVSILNNIMPTNQSSWLKIGYQCRPGALIVINGEPIVVGRSGIYEINNGMQITSFMIASPGGHNSNKIDAFLLDYAYDDGN